MISKDRFFEVLAISAANRADIDHIWEAAVVCASTLQMGMPGIGFMSVQKRLAAFFAVCRQLDNLTESGEVSSDEEQLSLLILRMANAPFNKAMTMFEQHHDRFGAKSRAEMPKSARLYLASMGI